MVYLKIQTPLIEILYTSTISQISEVNYNKETDAIFNVCLATDRFQSPSSLSPSVLYLGKLIKKPLLQGLWEFQTTEATSHVKEHSSYPHNSYLP